MRKFILTPLIAILLSFGLTLNLTAQDLMITGVFDGPLTGGSPKVLELYAVNDIADMSVYTVKNQTNANTTWGNDFALSGSAVAGDFIYIVNTGQTADFNAYFENTITPLESGVINLNGDDRVAIFNASDVMVDLFGEDGVDGTTTAWEWLDGWAYRNAGAVATATFAAADWTFSGINVTDGETLNSTATTPFPLGTYIPPVCAPGQTELFLTTSGGSYSTEKWVDITTEVDGAGTVIWAQGDGTYGNGAGLLTDESVCVDNGVTYYINAYDKYDDGWDGTTYSLEDQFGTVVANNGGTSPNDGTDADVDYNWEDRAIELESSEAFSYTPPTCPQVSDLAITSTNATDASLTWTENGSATAWNIIYGAPSFDPATEGTTVAADAIPFTVTGLTPETDYEFYVQADCGAGDLSSLSGPVATTTISTCPQPTDVAAIPGSDMAEISWNAYGITEWNIKISTTSIDPLTADGDIVANETTTNNPYTATGLTANTTYYVYVQSSCGSDWSLESSFTTECATLVAPFAEDFENAGSIPSCWSQGASNGEDWLFNNSGTGHIGNNGTIGGSTASDGYFAWIDDSSPHSIGTELISPMIDVSGLTTPELRFYLISNNEGSSNVDFSVDVYDGAAWVADVYTSNSNTANGEWEQIIVSLSSLTITGDIQIKFVVDENNGTDYSDDIAIDDVTVDEAPACPQISDLAITSVGTTEATITWTENGTASAWNIVYGTPGFDPTTDGTTIVATAIPAIITGLTSNTAYDVYVQADCGTDVAVLVGPVNFSTLCEVLTTLPFNETFNSDSPNEGCWTVIDENGDGDEWDLNYTSNTFEGDQVAMLYTDYNGGNNNDYLVTPGIALTGNEILTYQYRTQSSSETDEFEVLLSTTGIAPADFTEVLVPQAVYSNTSYQMETVDLSAYSGTVYIAWHVPSSTVDGWRVYIDDVKIRALSDENAIIDLTHANLTAPAVIDGAAYTVTAEVAMGTDLLAFAPDFTISDFATISPESGVAQDFTAGAVAYTVTSESGIPQVWNVTVAEATTQSDEKDILTFVLAEETAPAAINPGTVDISVAWTTTDVTALVPTITVSDFATISPESGVAQDFTNPVTYTVTAEDGSTQDYVVTVTIEDAPLGANCANPHTVTIPADLPYAHMTQTNCGLGNVYSETASGNYDGGEDVIYEITVTETSILDISMDPHGTSWTTLALFDACPETGALISNVNNSSAPIIEGITLDPGTYYIMLDTWPTPNCIPEYDLFIETSCPAPSGVTTANLLATSTDIEWVAGGIETNWNLKVSTVSIDPTVDAADVFDAAVATTPSQNLTGLTGETMYYVYVQADCGSDWTTEYTFTTPADCAQPSDVMASADIDMAEISWTAYGMTEWNIKISTTSIDPTTTEGDVVANETTTNNPYTASGLTANTTYYVYVQASCGSDWSTEYMFTTMCDVVSTLPWTETFEDDSETRACWSQEQVTGTQSWSFATGSTAGSIADAYEGTLNAQFTSSSAGGVTKLISPVFDLSAATALDLTFFYGQEDWSGDQNTLTVYYRMSDADAWVELATYSDNIAAWTMETISLPEFSATYQIAFEATDAYGRGNVLDNVMISAPAVNIDLALIEPSSGYACDLSATQQVPFEVENAGTETIVAGATFTFTMESEGITLFSEDISTDADLAAGETFMGMTTNTVDLSAIGTTFYTASITNANDNNADNDTIHGYIVHFEQTLEFVDAVNDTIDANAWPYTIETMVTINPDSTLVTEYLWEDGSTLSTLDVNAEGWYSVTITTEDCEYTDSVYVLDYTDVNDFVTNEFAVYPNPTSGIFTIDMTLVEKQDVVITIISNNGQIVREMRFDDINKIAQEIDMSDVAEGLYNIRVNAGGDMTNHQIIIR